MGREHGFSLLEVLVAVAVLAIAMVALVEAGAHQTRLRTDLTATTLGTWVAANALESLRIEEPWPAVGERTGQARMGARDWYWELTITQSEEARIRRVDVTVTEEPGGTRQVARLTGFLGEP